jgi:hypothetical protein
MVAFVQPSVQGPEELAILLSRNLVINPELANSLHQQQLLQQAQQQTLHLAALPPLGTHCETTSTGPNPTGTRTPPAPTSRTPFIRAAPVGAGGS